MKITKSDIKQAVTQELNEIWPFSKRKQKAAPKAAPALALKGKVAISNLYPDIIDWGEIPNQPGYHTAAQKKAKVSEFQDDEVRELWKNWQCQIPRQENPQDTDWFRGTEGNYGFGCRALYTSRKEALSDLITNPGAQDEYGRVVGTATEGKMKISLERLREIVTEEVIKESVSPEDAQRTIVALLQGTAQNVTGDIMGAVYDEMYASDVVEPSAAPEEEEDFPTEYQSGGAYGDRPRVGFELDENMNEIIQQELALVLVEGLEEAVFQDPGGEADPDSHWGEERQKKKEEEEWRAGAEERGKENKKREQLHVDSTLQKKLHSYVAQLKAFIEKAGTYTATAHRADNRNVMDDIVNLLHGKMPYRTAANISSIDRKLIQELGDLIKALAKPYNAANAALRTRDYETHQARPPGPEKTRAQKERDRERSSMFLASHGIMQEDVEIEVIDD